jgi:outer membrane receptor protein involved in Fe transport
MKHLSCSPPKRHICLGFVSIFLAWSATAQVQNGQITGVVADPSGGVVYGAKIIARNPATGYETNVQTNEAGIYTAKELNPGVYVVRAAASGFKTAEASSLVLNAGTELRVDFKLQLGEHSETVEVTDAAAPVNTENSRLSQIVDSSQIANLPLNGRNVYDLIQYSPGATNVVGVMFENGANTVVNGVRENFNGFLINGVSNKGLSGGAVNQPILDTVQEFQLLTLNNSAQFGNSAGSITNLVTKSGTNQWHGSAWEFLRNDVLDANPFFANYFSVARTPLHLNQFGVTVGGPIKKNKLFFFAAYQGDRFITSNPLPDQVESAQFRNATISAFPNNVSSVLYSNFAPSSGGIPLTTLRNYVVGNFSGSGFSSFADYLCPVNTDPPNTSTPGAIARKFASLFGVEQADIDQMNPGACPGGSIFSAPQAGTFNRDATFLVNVLNPGASQTSGNLFNGNEASLRLDYNWSEKNRFFSQFNWSRATDQFTASGNLARGFTDPSKTITPNFQFSYIYMLSTTLLNEFRGGYAGNGNVITAALPGVPGISFDDRTLGFGSYNGYPQIFHENIYTYSDMVSLSQGKHNVKAGVEVRRNLENSLSNAGRPSYRFFDPLFFAIDAPYFEFAGVDPGIVSGTPARLADNVRHFRNWEVGAYVQDDWKVTRRLTLNLGLRYDLYTRHTELDNLATTFLRGPGQNYVDKISTGEGQIKNASTPCPGNPLATIAGICGPGGFAPAKTLGAGDHTDFGPRIGFAWDVFGNGRTALRAGFGISYEGTLYNPLSDTRWNPPYYSLNGIDNYLGGDKDTNVVYGPVAGGTPTFLGPAPPAQHSGAGVQATGNISGWDPSNPQLAELTAIVFPEGIRDPYVENWFLGVQREIRTGLSVEVNYVGTAGSRLLRAEDVNRIPGAKLPEGTCVTDSFGRKLCSQINTDLAPNGLEVNPLGLLNPNYGVLRVWENSANSLYHSLQLSAKKQTKFGLQVSGNYTYAHSIDSGSDWLPGATSTNGFAAGDGYTTDLTMPQLDRGNSTYDIRHRFTFNYVYELPFFRQTHGFTGMALGGWQWNGIFSVQSGAHWTPYNQDIARLTGDPLLQTGCYAVPFNPADCANRGGDYNLDGVQNDRPSAIANHVNATHDQWANGFNLPSGFFYAPCLGCVGNLARNTFVGPGYWDADTSLFKNCRISDRFNLQFRAEAFNIFNHTSFQIGNNQMNSPTFGQAGGTFPPRNLQFALKLSF